jgi:glycosyltransferase involved in cell wall biosynthesis
MSQKNPKIAIVHDFLLKLGGAERVLKCLSDLFPEAPIYTLLYDESKVGSDFPASRIRTSFLQKYPSFIRRRFKYLLPKMPQAVEEWDFNEFDIVISSSNSFAHGIITPPHVTHICYCHSPMRYAWDWSHEYLKEQSFGRTKEMIARRIIHQLRIWDRTAADRPDVILANSKNTQSRITKYWNQKSEIVYPPVDTSRFKASTHQDDYFLIVSAITPFKKIDLAVEAFNQNGLPLKIVGEGSQLSHLKSIANSNIEFLGHLSDEEITELYQNCRAFIFPGEEDFGITPAETMACGKPVIALNKGGVTETVIPDQTGIFFDEPTVNSLNSAISKFSEAEFDPQIIRQRAEEFGEEKFITQMKGIIEQYTS